MCNQPILHQPNYFKCFYLLTNASTYGVGAILCQKENEDPKIKLHIITFYSMMFTAIEHNYDIYKRKFLAILKLLIKSKLHVLGTKESV